MTPARWLQVKMVLAEALECVSASERSTLLDRSCAGDADLRRELESLLSQRPTIFDLVDGWENPRVAGNAAVRPLLPGPRKTRK